MKKGFLKSKRFWGIVVAVAGKILPSLMPEHTDIANHITEVGGLLFGYGCMDAKSPVGLSDSK